MATLVDAVVGKVAGEAVDSVWRQIGYIWNYKTNIDDLQRELVKLKAIRQSMLQNVDEARKNFEEIEDTAILWLNNADNAIKAADEILEGNDTSESSFFSCSPNLKARHQFSRKAKKETPIVIQVQQDRSSIPRISRRFDVQKLEFVKNYEALDSRMEALNFIVDTLKSDDTHLIGVYGLGGVGKTTLVKQHVIFQVKEEGVFKVVATADVTHKLDLSKIQQEISYWLDLNLDIDSIEIRAARLHARLMQEEKVLIVLDDIWEKIELEKIGIPNFRGHEGLKVLMTSRDLTVLIGMNVQTHFQLKALSEEEAWHIFQEKAGEFKSSHLQKIATRVAKRCAGLPILIVSVATSLRGQDLYEWEDALEHLQKFEDKGIDAHVYSALELSYKFLGDDQKSLLVLCAQLYGNIQISNLVKYAKGLDLFHNCRTIRVVRNKVLKVVNDLKRACLLQEGEDTSSVEMQDIIRRFATIIASKQHHIFTVAFETELEEWPKDAFELCTAISLPPCKIPDLPQVLECPKLESFILCNDDPSLEIPDMFFSRMEKLKLLDLFDVDLLPFPSSLCFPQNLQTLCLDYCALEDISAIGILSQLQVLSLIGSSIVQLPMEINNLTRLQFLDLSECQRLEVILPGILICLTKLEELCMLGSFVKWEGGGHIGKRNNASLSELKTLSNLINLEIHIIDVKILPVFHGKLERFRILIGDSWDSSNDGCDSSKVLKLSLNVGFESERVRILLIETEDLHLDDLKDVKNVIPELEREGFPKLKNLQIQNCHEMQVIVDRTRMGNIIFFSNLESLSLLNLNKLENICFGPFVSTSFNNLNKLRVGNCNALQNLFSFTMFRCLVNLHEIDVSHCEILKEIVAGRYEDETIQMTQLRSLALKDLPQLEAFCSPTNEASAELSLVDEFEILFGGEEIQFPNLVELKLSSVNVEKIWRDQSKELCPFNKLTVLTVQGCRNLIFALTSSMAKTLVQLKELDISDCKLMEEVISTEGGGIEEIIFPKLYLLKLKSLPKVVQFCRGKLMQFPSMEVLWIEACDSLQTFVTSNEVCLRQNPNPLFDEKVYFPSLLKLVIYGVYELKLIWDSFYKLTLMEKQMRSLELYCLPNLSTIWNQVLQTLERLYIYGCDSLIILAPSCSSFQSLTFLAIHNCEGLVSLLNSSVAKSLLQLQALKVSKCNRLKVIVSDDGDEVIDEINFIKLEFIELDDLPSLASFCSENHNLGFPCLEKVVVKQCPQMEFFSKGISITPMLACVQKTKEDKVGNWLGNLNSTIQFMFKKRCMLEVQRKQSSPLGTTRGSGSVVLQHDMFPVARQNDILIQLHSFALLLLLKHSESLFS